MGKTVFISDLDGTLLNNNAKITPTAAKIINRLIDEGLIFTYATARGFATSSKVTGDINFKYPVVHHNGACVQDPRTGEYFKKCILEKDKIAEVIKILEKNSVCPVVYSFIDGSERFSWLFGKENEGTKFFLKVRETDKRRRPVKDYGEFLEGDIHGISFFGESAEELHGILDIIKLDGYFTYHVQEDTYTYKSKSGNKLYWLEIIRFDAGKDSGVKKVKELVGADKIVCFGDNINDIPMFGASDEKYAVANAVQELKNIADGVIGSNEDDGVAKWLEKNAYNYF